MIAASKSKPQETARRSAHGGVLTASKRSGNSNHMAWCVNECICQTRMCCKFATANGFHRIHKVVKGRIKAPIFTQATRRNSSHQQLSHAALFDGENKEMCVK
jgi:hypothetical protein